VPATDLMPRMSGTIRGTAIDIEADHPLAVEADARLPASLVMRGSRLTEFLADVVGELEHLRRSDRSAGPRDFARDRPPTAIGGCRVVLRQAEPGAHVHHRDDAARRMSTPRSRRRQLQPGPAVPACTRPTRAIGRSERWPPDHGGDESVQPRPSLVSVLLVHIELPLTGQIWFYAAPLVRRSVPSGPTIRPGRFETWRRVV